MGLGITSLPPIPPIPPSLPPSWEAVVHPASGAGGARRHLYTAWHHAQGLPPCPQHWTGYHSHTHTHTHAYTRTHTRTCVLRLSASAPVHRASARAHTRARAHGWPVASGAWLASAPVVRQSTAHTHVVCLSLGRLFSRSAPVHQSLLSLLVRLSLLAHVLHLSLLALLVCLPACLFSQCCTCPPVPARHLLVQPTPFVGSRLSASPCAVPQSLRGIFLFNLLPS